MPREHKKCDLPFLKHPSLPTYMSKNSEGNKVPCSISCVESVRGKCFTVFHFHSLSRQKKMRKLLNHVCHLSPDYIHQYVVSLQAIFQKFAISSRAGFKMWTYLLLTIYKKPFLHNRVSKPDLFFTDFHFTQGDIKSFLKLGLKFYQKIFS